MPTRVCGAYPHEVGAGAWGSRATEAVLAVSLAAAAWTELALSSDRDLLSGYLWVAATTLPLALRSRAPVRVGLGIQLVFALGTALVLVPQLLAQGLSVFLIATYVAALGASTWARSVAVGLTSIGLLSLQAVLDPVFGAAGAVLANCVYVAMSWAVAAAVRVKVDQSDQFVAAAQTAARTSEDHARRAVQQERERLARELHDVLGHSISVMVLRARGGVHEHRLDPEQGLAALRDVEAVGARALADVRMLMELDDGPPPEDHRRLPMPGVENIVDLVAQTVGVGAEIELSVRGTPRPVSDGLGLAAYRVTQEALTNVRRHSLSPRATVVLTWTERELSAEISDEGPARPERGGGRGLIGMRERVSLVGGTLSARDREGGGFVVHARIPLDGPP